MNVDEAKKILSESTTILSSEILTKATSIILSELNKAEEKIHRLEKGLRNIENLPNEIWKDIPGYVGLYQVSNKGRVKSLRWNGERILKLSCCNYMNLTLTKDGRQQHFHVHKLVAKAFIPNPNNFPIINHKDGNKKNNCVENLEWTTYSENNLHAYRTGLKDPKRNASAGERNGSAKLTNAEAKYIRDNYKARDKNFGAKALAKKI